MYVHMPVRLTGKYQRNGWKTLHYRTDTFNVKASHEKLFSLSVDGVNSCIISIWANIEQ